MENYEFQTKIKSVVCQYRAKSATQRHKTHQGGARLGSGKKSRPRLLMTGSGKLMAALGAQMVHAGGDWRGAGGERGERGETEGREEVQASPLPLGGEGTKMAKMPKTSNTFGELGELAWIKFVQNVDNFLEYPDYVSSCLSYLPTHFITRLSCFLSENKRVSDGVIAILARTGGAEELALWGPGITNYGVSLIKPTLNRYDSDNDDDDEESQDSDGWEGGATKHCLTGFTNLKKVEICDTDNVSIR